MSRLWIAAHVVLLLAGCGEQGGRTAGPLPPEYAAYDSPDNLIANLGMAWEAMDLAEYRDSVLYGGVTPCSNGESCDAFVFCYDQLADPSLPDCEDYDRCIRRITRLFSGLPSDSLPGIKSIDLTVTAFGNWEPVPDCNDCPPGALQREYLVEGLITFKEPMPDGGDHVWEFAARGETTCAPATGSGQAHWRLWQWREYAIPGSASLTFGQVYMLYPLDPKGR